MRLIVLMTIMTCGVAYGQLQKGSFMIGGSARIQRAESPGLRNGVVTSVPVTSASLSPTVGYFIVDNWVAGLSTSISGAQAKSGDLPNRSRGFSVGSFTRYYFPFAKFAAFPAISAQWGTERSYYKLPVVNGIDEYKTETNTATYQAGAGMAWFISSHAALEGILFYSQQKNNNTSNNITFSLGLQFYIPAKESN